MSSPPLRGTAEWSANREVALLLGLTGGNRYAAQQLWLRKERIKAEASQFASAGAPQASQQPAGCRAKPATAKAQGVPKRSSAAQLAKKSRRLNQKHLATLKHYECYNEPHYERNIHYEFRGLLMPTALGALHKTSLLIHMPNA